MFVGQKAVQSTDIPLEIIKENADIFGSYLCELFNDCIDKGIFPNILKHANMSVFKSRYRGCITACGNILASGNISLNYSWRLKKQ